MRIVYRRYSSRVGYHDGLESKICLDRAGRAAVSDIGMVVAALPAKRANSGPPLVSDLLRLRGARRCLRLAMDAVGVSVIRPVVAACVRKGWIAAAQLRKRQTASQCNVR